MKIAYIIFNGLLSTCFATFLRKIFEYFELKSFPQESVENPVENCFSTNLIVDFQSTFSTLHISNAIRNTKE